MTERSTPVVSPSARVRAAPPAGRGKYWRITVLDASGDTRIRQTTGGATRESAERRVLDLERALAAHAPVGAAATRGSQLLDYYLDESRPKNQAHPDRPARWSATYTDQARGLVDRYLRPILDQTPLTAWAAEHAYRVLDRCPTNYLVGKVRRILSAVLTLGVSNGFLRPDQRDLHRVTVPLRPEQRPARRPRARTLDATALLQPDEVPSLAQVQALADARPPGTTPLTWEAIVNALAYGGFRIGELFALAAGDARGLPDGLVAVRWQVIEPSRQAKRLAPPKNGFGRLVAICETTPLGFPLRDWLHGRAEDAAAEQTAGINPAAALFVTPRGTWWTRSNFRSRCFNPAAAAAGWKQTTWLGPVRRRQGSRWVVVQAERHDWQHPIHALRHHYACTARDTWGWSGAELCLNGGWADEAFVASRYYGSTAETYRQALVKQAAAAAPGTVPRLAGRHE